MDKQTTIQTLKKLASLISVKEELTGPASNDIDSQTRNALRSIREKHFGWYGISHPSLARDTLNVFYKVKPIPYSLFAYAGLGIAMGSICFLPQIIGWSAYFTFLICVVIALALIAILIPKDGIKKRIFGDAATEYKRVQESLKCYEQQVQRGVQQLAERKATYPKAFAECLQEIECAEAKKDDIQHKIIAYDNEISAIDLITPKHYHLLDSIIDLLETGCADSCKEALNMAISQEAEQQHRRTLERIKCEELEHKKAAQEKQDKINDMLEEELRWKIHDRFYKK